MTSVGVIGLGYVGLTLAVSLARKGLKVYGVDTSPRVLEALTARRSHLFEPGVEAVAYDSLRDLVEKVRHYLAHESERAEIAAAGQSRTLREHTYTRRMAELAEILDERRS